MRRPIALLAACLIVSACGSRDPGDAQADALDNAAEQSDPAAAPALHNQADAIRDTGSAANLAAPNSPAQNALQSAGDAAADETAAPERAH